MNRWRHLLPYRKPDLIIQRRNAEPYLLRWYVIPKNRWFNIYLHKLVADDEPEAHHDHPWASVSLVLWGAMYEYVTDSVNRHYIWRRLLRAGRVVVRGARFAHRLELYNGKPAWTLFVTGPKVREWGFLCPQGWRHWEEFCSPTDSGRMIRGCGEIENVHS